MKSKITKGDTYPKLMYNGDNGTTVVIIATKQNEDSHTGTVVYSDSRNHAIGDSDDYWYEFKDFSGEITLSN
jgi:hypothetical protein